MASHEVLGGKVNVYKRGDNRFWQCSASIGGRQFRFSTKEESLELAKEVAEDWYLTLRGKDRAGLLPTGKTFEMAAQQFMSEYTVITEGQRSPKWVEGHGIRLRLHLLPFFGSLRLSEVTPGKVQEYRVHRMTSRLDPKTGQPKRPSRSTLHDEIVTLRLVLKTAIRHQWLTHLPDLSPPYRTQGKISHRPWFCHLAVQNRPPMCASKQASPLRCPDHYASWVKSCQLRLLRHGCFSFPCEWTLPWQLIRTRHRRRVVFAGGSCGR